MAQTLQAHLAIGGDGGGALIQNGVPRPVEEQPRHGQALLLAAAQRLLPVLHLLPAPVAPADLLNSGQQHDSDMMLT